MSRCSTCGMLVGCDYCANGDQWTPDARGTNEDVVVYCPQHNVPIGPLGCVECLREDRARDLDLQLVKHSFPVDGNA